MGLVFILCCLESTILVHTRIVNNDLNYKNFLLGIIIKNVEV